MAKYEVYIDHDLWDIPMSSKDDVIQSLMSYINGDGVVKVQVIYPDKSYYELEGEA